MYYSGLSPCKDTSGPRTAGGTLTNHGASLASNLSRYVGRRGRFIVAGSHHARRTAAILSDLPVLSADRPRARRAPGVGSLLHLRHMWGALDPRTPHG